MPRAMSWFWNHYAAMRYPVQAGGQAVSWTPLRRLRSRQLSASGGKPQEFLPRRMSPELRSHRRRPGSATRVVAGRRARGDASRDSAPLPSRPALPRSLAEDSGRPIETPRHRPQIKARFRRRRSGRRWPRLRRQPRNHRAGRRCAQRSHRAAGWSTPRSGARPA